MKKLSPKLLFPVVLVIWSLVIWRIWGPEEEEILPLPPVPTVALQEEASDWPDSLFLDYADPFLGGNPNRQVSVSSPQARQSPQVRVIRPTRNWSVPDLVYKGGVRRDESITGILRYEGRDMMVRPGDSIPGIRILAMDLSSISMRMRDSVITMRVQP